MTTSNTGISERAQFIDGLALTRSGKFAPIGRPCPVASRLIRRQRRTRVARPAPAAA